jgi:dipeptidyl aminopeptidase/acylaminoacyl peptidase
MFRLSRPTLAIVLGMGRLLTLQDHATSTESVRSELIRLQQRSRWSLMSLNDEKIYSVSFKNHSLNQPTPIPTNGTVMYGGFSPDGSRVAVSLCRGGLTHPTPYRTDCPGGIVLAIMRPDGTDEYQYDYLSNPGFVCWSHDSSKIALNVQDRRRDRFAPLALQVFDLRTEATQVITENTDAFVDNQCWSPDDKQVAYTASNMGGHGLVSIYDVRLQTSREFSKGSRATWSPDGNWIALLDCPASLRGCKYYAVRSTGEGRRLLFESESATALWWSPDSRFVAYVNAAIASERTAAQQEREMVRLRVRRLDDNAMDSFNDFFDGNTMDFQWVVMDSSIPSSQ